MKILITGGAGYIGSTIASALEDSGHTPVILDSLVTGRIEFTRGRAFYQGRYRRQSAGQAGFQRTSGYFRGHPLRRADRCAGIHRKTL